MYKERQARVMLKIIQICRILRLVTNRKGRLTGPCSRYLGKILVNIPRPLASNIAYKQMCNYDVETIVYIEAS